MNQFEQEIALTQLAVIEGYKLNKWERAAFGRAIVFNSLLHVEQEKAMKTKQILAALIRNSS